MHCSLFDKHYSSVLYATCVVVAIIYHWVITALCLSNLKVDRNKKYTNRVMTLIHERISLVFILLLDIAPNFSIHCSAELRTVFIIC